jgi:glycosyltransferase involved in cell wall biosynthesis
MIKVAAFTAGAQISTARFRVRQYIPVLKEYGIDLHEFFAPLGSYPPRNRLVRPLWGVASLGSRLPGIVRSHGYDLVLFQREMLSTFFTLEPLTKRPRVLDVDDAIWLRRDGSFARRLARICDLVICGNAFLAQQFGGWNASVSVLPTAVDTERFLPAKSESGDARMTIGWSGASDGFVDLKIVEKALQVTLRMYPKARLRVMSNEVPRCLDLPAEQVEFIPWSPEAEVRAIQGMSIGIMPLEDNLWNRGKCAYKMLLYMSCGVPVVVSPVGMNDELLRAAPIGRGARNTEEWVDALGELLCRPEGAADMGQRGRDLVVERFSVSAIAPRLAAQLSQLVS